MQILFHKALLSLFKSTFKHSVERLTSNPTQSEDKRGSLCTAQPTWRCNVTVHTTGREFLGFSDTVMCDFTHRDLKGEALFHRSDFPHSPLESRAHKSYKDGNVLFHLRVCELAAAALDYITNHFSVIAPSILTVKPTLTTNFPFMCWRIGASFCTKINLLQRA